MQISTKMIDYVKNHTLHTIYSLIFIVLSYGVWVDSGTKFIPLLAIFYTSFTVIYFVARKMISSQNLNIPSFRLKIKPEFLFLGSIILILAHFITLKTIPTFDAMKALDGDTVSLIRMNISVKNGLLFNYISSFLIHSILPFTLLFLYLKEKTKLYYILIIITAFYGFSLMQKSYILTLFLPIIIYSILSKKIVNTLLTSSIVIITIITLTYVANPQLVIQDTPQKIEPLVEKQKTLTTNSENSLLTIVKALERRVILVPGEMISIWFKNIPEILPHQGLNGYGFIAKLKGIEHLDYGRELYPILHPEDKALKGTLNAANFMYEYANFGTIGLILAGVILALIFTIVEVIFAGNFQIKIALNLYSILILSSSSLTTLMFSGGWGLMTLLFIAFKSELKPSLEHE